MKCEDQQFNISIYPDGVLTEVERQLADSHLANCHLCREKYRQIKSIRASLHGLGNEEMPASDLASLRSAVSDAIYLNKHEPFFNSARIDFLKLTIFPYTAATLATLLLFFGLFNSIMVVPIELDTAERSKPFEIREIAMVNLSEPKSHSAENSLLSARDFALQRRAFSKESPSINPEAVVALANTLLRKEAREDEVVLVAEVFGDGFAKITKVVEAPREPRILQDLEIALQTDKNFAPFVPASMDGRPENLQIVLKFQRVDVSTETPKPRRKNTRARA